MFEEKTETIGGEAEVKEKPKAKAKAKPPSRADRIAAWKEENRAEFEVAKRACSCCTPTKAQMLLIQQFNGYDPIPID